VNILIRNYLLLIKIKTMKKFTFLIICIVILGSCKDRSESTSIEAEHHSGIDLTINEQVAYANGFKEFEDVKQLNFTFNVKVNDTLRTSRAWKWFPQEDRIELTEKGETITYNNDGDFTEPEQAADRKFINDTYWLLFPYQLVWSDFDMEHTQNAEAPISKEQMQQLTISFENEGGYTPGDTYHIFFKNDKLIKEWTYVSSGGRSLSTTWEDYKDFDGIKIAMMHKSEDESFQLFFTDVEVIK
jgi:hypothetical protein